MKVFKCPSCGREVFRDDNIVCVGCSIDLSGMVDVTMLYYYMKGLKKLKEGVENGNR